MSVYRVLYSFTRSLREAGIPVSPDAVVQCFSALRIIDWEKEDYFYAVLLSTLVKDYSYWDTFHRVYDHYFKIAPLPGESLPEALARLGELQATGEGRFAPGEAKGNEAGRVDGEAGSGGGAKRQPPPAGQAAPAESFNSIYEKDFNSLTGAEIKTLENLLPVMTRRIAAKLVKKRKQELRGALDFRRTFRSSLATGGVPVNTFTRPKIKEKPVIVSLCDVSNSVWRFSLFSLALVHSLERFYLQARSFAFIDQIDEITALLRAVKPHSLRSTVLNKAAVIAEGRTDYGHCFKTFFLRFEKVLTPRTHLLIFGDSRNNWQSSEEEFLGKVAQKVKRIYWFNPEPEALWNTGDSIMKSYRQYCCRAYSCRNLKELETAINQM